MATIIIFFILLFLSFNFSGSETAIFSILKTELDQIRVKFIRNLSYNLKENERITLFVLLVANTIVNSYAASIFSVLFKGFGWNLKSFSFASGIAEVIVLTFIILLLGEVTPKIISVKYPLKMMKVYSFVVSPFYFLLRPLATVVTNKLFACESTSIDVLDEVEELAIESDPLLKSRISLLDTTVGEIMTSKDSVVFLKPEDRISDLYDLLNRYGFSNYPVLKGEDLIGMVSIKDLRLANASKDEVVTKYLLPCASLPSNTGIVNFLKTYKSDDFFAVVDEYGTFVGIFTFDDILKRIFPEPKVQWIGKKVLLVKGSLSLSELEYILGRRLPFDAPTVQALLMEHTGTIPGEGEIIQIGGLKFEIVEKEFSKLKKIKVEVL